MISYIYVVFIYKEFHISISFSQWFYKAGWADILFYKFFTGVGQRSPHFSANFSLSLRHCLPPILLVSAASDLCNLSINPVLPLLKTSYALQLLLGSVLASATFEDLLHVYPRAGPEHLFQRKHSLWRRNCEELGRVGVGAWAQLPLSPPRLQATEAHRAAFRDREWSARSTEQEREASTGPLREQESSRRWKCFSVQ